MWNIEEFLSIIKEIIAYKDITESLLLLYRSGIAFRPNFVIFVVD